MNFEEIIIRGNKRMTLGDLKLLDKTAREINAKNIVEIGSMDGTSSLLLGFVVKDTNGHLYCCEPYPKAKWKKNMKEAYLEDKVTLIMGMSPWIDTTMIPKPLDYLLIDGKHETRWALVDYHFWFKYIKIGGRIAFHDWTGGQGVGQWIKRAVKIILETDNKCIKEVGRYEAKNRGLIVFEKIAENPWC